MSSISSLRGPLESIALACEPAKRNPQIPFLKKNSRPIWQKYDNELTFGRAPQNNLRYQWRNLSSWETLLAIEELMIEGSNFLALSKAGKKHLRNNLIEYVSRIASKNENLIDMVISCIKHGLRGQGWISTSSKADQLISRMYEIEAIARNRIPMAYWPIEEKMIYHSLYDKKNHPRSGIYTYPDSKRKNINDVAPYNKYRDLTSELKGIGFINGIDNPKPWAENTARYIGRMAAGKDYDGVKTTNVYNSTFGVIADLKEAFWGWRGHNTRPVNLLMQMWDQFFDQFSLEDRPKARFLMFCHSQGAVHVKNALAHYDPILRQQIEVVCIAPGGFPDPKHCAKDCYHAYLVGFKYDIIPIIDWVWTGSSLPPGIVTTVPSKGEDYQDHDFRSVSYARYIRKHVQEFVNKKLI